MQPLMINISRSVLKLTIKTSTGQTFDFWKSKGENVLQALGIPKGESGDFAVSERRWDYIARNSFRV